MAKLRSGFLGFVLGISLTVLIVAGTAFGASVLEVVLNNVNIMVDGVEVAKIGENYSLANGDTVPFSILYKGTTYLPIRKVGELINKEVGYIGTSNTVVLGKMPEVKQPGWYLVKKEISREMQFFTEGKVGTSEKWEADADYISRNEGNVEISKKNYLINSAGVKSFTSEDNAKFSWTKAAEYIEPGGTFSINASMTSNSPFGASIYGSINTSHRLSPLGDGSSHYVEPGDSTTLLKSRPMAAAQPGTQFTVTLRLSALGDYTNYVYVYEYYE